MTKMSIFNKIEYISDNGDIISLQPTARLKKIPQFELRRTKINPRDSNLVWKISFTRKEL